MHAIIVISYVNVNKSHVKKVILHVNILNSHFDKYKSQFSIIMLHIAFIMSDTGTSNLKYRNYCGIFLPPVCKKFSLIVSWYARKMKSAGTCCSVFFEGGEVQIFTPPPPPKKTNQFSNLQNHNPWWVGWTSIFPIIYYMFPKTGRSFFKNLISICEGGGGGLADATCLIIIRHNYKFKKYQVSSTYMT